MPILVSFKACSLQELPDQLPTAEVNPHHDFLLRAADSLLSIMIAASSSLFQEINASADKVWLKAE